MAGGRNHSFFQCGFGFARFIAEQFPAGAAGPVRAVPLFRTCGRDRIGLYQFMSRRRSNRLCQGDRPGRGFIRKQVAADCAFPVLNTAILLAFGLYGIDLLQSVPSCRDNRVFLCNLFCAFCVSEQLPAL